MTGQSLAEVLQEVADARCLNHGPNYGGCVDCSGAAEECADAVTAHLAAILADPDVKYGAGTLHDNAPRDYSDEEAHIWTVGYRAALEYVAERLGCEVQA